ncbi:hypothetical protein ACFL00_02820 [Pseudomonadota bacterium]
MAFRNNIATANKEVAIYQKVATQVRSKSPKPQHSMAPTPPLEVPCCHCSVFRPVPDHQLLTTMRLTAYSDKMTLQETCWRGDLMGWLKKFIPSTSDFGAATNALLAERLISSNDLIAERASSLQLAQRVMVFLREGGFPNAADELIMRQFNRKNRYVQLNIIALSLNKAGVSTGLTNEFWHVIDNPFRLELDESNLRAVSDRLNNDHDLSLEIKTPSLRMSDQGIEDV